MKNESVSSQHPEEHRRPSTEGVCELSSASGESDDGVRAEGWGESVWQQERHGLQDQED